MYNFPFAETVKVTKLAHSLNPEYKENNVVDVYVCVDTKDIHLLRVVKDFNIDYEPSEGKWLVEYERLPRDRKEHSNTQVMEILKDDYFETYDLKEVENLEEATKLIAQSWGIIIPEEEK